MILDIHCHTSEHSLCSHVEADDLVQSIFDKGLDGMVLTDHHYLWSPDEIRGLRSRIKVSDYFLILAGQEVETPEFGHVLVYGADVSISRGASVESIRDRFPDAALVWAHPYRDERVPTRERLQHLLIDGIEIFNTNHTVAENNRGLRDWHRYKFTALSGTDTHALSYTALYPSMFDHPVSNVQELAREIRAGRCRPFFREMSHSGTSNTRVTEVAIGTGRAEEQFVIRSHDSDGAWRTSLRTARIIEELRAHGFHKGRYRVPEQLGKDENSFTVIEQGIRGRNLFDVLVSSSPEDSRRYLRMSAEWLARLHRARLQITPPGEYMHEEPNRLEYYLSAFYRTGNRHTRRAQEIMDTVIDMESALYCNRRELMVQGHGDYHPKNIFIGRDRKNGASEPFIAAIDFSSSFSMPPAFDVGTFLAQFRNQFYGNSAVLSKVSDDLFLEVYLHEVFDVESDFLSQVELFKARTAMSICYYLIKVGMGGSDNLWRVLAEAGRVLTHLQVKSRGAAVTIEQAEDQRKTA